MASRKLVVEIVGDARSLERTLGRATRQTRGFSASLGSIAKSAAVFGGITAGIAGVGAALRSGISEFADAQKAASQTAAAIKSTGGVANVTAKQVEALATSIQRYSGIDDEAVQSGENLLLTFRNVRNEAGKGNAIFDRATRAAVDLSVRGFGSIESTSKTLGKALQDPVRGMTALRRAGVTFTEAQQKAIKRLVETGKTLEAQKLILREVETQVGGSAKAYGDTLPGQLNKLRESFRNLAGDLVGKVAPGFTRALEGVNDFVDRISQARTTRAKFNIVFEGIETIGRGLFRQLQESFRQIDWVALVDTVRTGLLQGVRALGAAIGQIDFGTVGQVIGQAIARSLSGVAAFLQSVDWSVVGGAIVRGLIDFLKNVPWRALLIGIVKLQVAAFRAAASLLLGVGKELGKALLDGLLSVLRGLGAAVKGVLTRAFDGLVALAIRTALKIIEPFTHIPRRLGGGTFQEMKASLKRQLDAMVTDSQSAAGNVQAALDGIHGVTVPVNVNVTTTVDDKPAGGTNRSAAVPTPDINKILAPWRKAADIITTTTAKASKIVAAAQARAAKAAAARARAAAAKQRKAFEGLLDSISLQIDKAAATKGFSDDLRANTALQNAIKRQIAIEGRTTELARALFDAQQARATIVTDAAAKAKTAREKAAAATKAALQAGQFKALGLDATGGTVTPTVRNLRRQLSQLTERLGSDVSPRIASQLERVGKVLSGKFGKVTEQTRAKIKELFESIRSGLSDGAKDLSQGPLTKTTSLNTNKILEGLGLGRDLEKELRSRLSGFNSAGFALGGKPALATGGFATAPIVVENHNTLTMDGDVVSRKVTRSQQKAVRRNPPQRRGPNAR